MQRVVDDKARALAEIHHDREVAKELVNSLINLGSVDSWRKRYAVEQDPPKWVRDLAALLEVSAKADAQENQKLANACEKLSGLTYWLSCIDERKSLDAIEVAADAVPVSFEGDGIFFVKRSACPDHWAKQVVLKASAEVAPCSHKKIPPFPQVCAAVLQRWAKAHIRPCVASVNVEPPAPEVILTTGEFELVKTSMSVEAATCKGSHALKTEPLFDGGKGRHLVLLKTQKPQNVAFEALSRCTLGVLAASFGDATICLAVKEKNRRLNPGLDHTLSTLTPTKVKLTDARVSEVVQLLFKQAHTKNFHVVPHRAEFIPEFEQLTAWLGEQLKQRKYMEIVFDCKRLIALKKANAFESALIKVSPAQMKEFAEHFEQACQCLRRVDDATCKTYPRDFAADAPKLRGVLWNGVGGIRVVTLEEVLDERCEESTLAQQRTMIFVGRANCGKTTLLRALARELSHRVGLEVFAESTALDPFGIMTRARLTKDIGAVCLNDFELTTCQPFSQEMGKALLDVRDTTSFNARYHCATLPAARPRMWAVNPDSVDENGSPLWASWFCRSDASSPLAHLVDERGDVIKTLPEGSKAIVRRAVIFKVDKPLYEPPKQTIEPPEQLRRRELAEAASRYQL